MHLAVAIGSVIETLVQSLLSAIFVWSLWSAHGLCGVHVHTDSTQSMWTSSDSVQSVWTSLDLWGSVNYCIITCFTPLVTARMSNDSLQQTPEYLTYNPRDYHQGLEVLCNIVAQASNPQAQLHFD